MSIAPTAYTVPDKGTQFAKGDVLGLPAALYHSLGQSVDFMRRHGELVVARALSAIRLPAGADILIFEEKKPLHGPRKKRP